MIHPTAGPESTSPVSRLPVRPLLALCGAALMAGIFFWLKGDSSQSCDDNVVVSQERLLDLPDASSVITSSATVLCYAPALVKNHRRQVNLQRGSAYFEVAHNPAQPFMVHTLGEATVEVKGTGFNVTSDPEQGIARIAVAHGLVVVHFDGEEFEVTPEHQLTLNVNTRKTRVETFDPNRVSWPFPRLSFKNATLEEIARTLDNHFHATVIIKSDELKKCAITAEFENEQVTLDNILRTLSLVLGKMTYERRGSVVIVHGQQCSN